MAATDSATSTFTGNWLTVAQQNAVIGYPDNPEWPGPVSENHADAGVPDPGRSGPPQGAAPPGIPSVDAPPLVDLSGGEDTDSQATVFGYSAPLGPTFSQDTPFAPPGPVSDTHGYDTGGTSRKEHVPVPDSPGWWRRVMTGQTFNRQAQVTDSAGWAISAPNDRVNFNQDQGQNANGYDPFVIPYAERPLKANFAAEAYPLEGGVPGPYGLDGALPDMTGLGGQGNFAYTSPPDPYVTVAAPAGSTPPSYEPSSGLEYVNYG